MVKYDARKEQRNTRRAKGKSRKGGRSTPEKKMNLGYPMDLGEMVGSNKVGGKEEEGRQSELRGVKIDRTGENVTENDLSGSASTKWERLAGRQEM